MAGRETRFVQCAAALNGYIEAASAVGLNPGAMLRRVGFNPLVLDQPNTMVSFDRFLDLLALSAQESGCADFGIRMGIARGIPNLGTISLLMREADNIQTAMHLMSSHMTLHTNAIFSRLDTRFDSPIITVEMSCNSREELVQATQLCVVGNIILFRWLMGHFEPELISFAYSKPKTSRVNELFNCPVSYNQTLSGLVIDRKSLTTPFITSTPFLRKLALQQLEPILRRTADSFATQVKRVVAQMLHDGECSAEAVARHLDIDRRTLNRRLEREGETFSTVLQQVRTETVRHAIEGTDYSLTELADMAGFHSLSAFSRWFQAHFGCTASEWRRRAAMMGIRRLDMAVHTH